MAQPVQKQAGNKPANKNAMAADPEKSKSARYKESDIIRKFLGSGKGIPFLIDSQRARQVPASSMHSRDLYRRVDDLIDFFTCWTNNFPVRKNLKVSKYEFLKCVENFCAKAEISQAFYPMLEE